MNNNRPILSVFIDGLKPDSLKFMPFLDSFGYKRRMKTELGYSITCHSSMYTGVYPEKHKMWFLWQYSPQSSPFKWMKQERILDWGNSLPLRYFLGKMTRLFSNNTSYAGVSIMKHSALKNWKYFDISEKKLWSEAGYIEDYDTIFDFMRHNEVSFDLVGLTNSKNDGGSLKHIRNYSVSDKVPEMTYLFIGELDCVSHFYGQESEQARKVLKNIDEEIKRVYGQFKKKTGVDPLFMCWSDHGHMMIEHQFDIYEHFNEKGIKLSDFIHIIDTNFARFWFRNDDERQLVTQACEDIPSGFFLEQKHLEKYHVQMPDRRYGDIIYYLDHPYMFKKTIWGYGLRTKSIHGYLPEYPEKDGVFVSNNPVVDQKHIELVDITPSLLELLGIKTTVAFDGKTIWK